MGAYLARRVLLMVPTLVGITFMVFMLMALAPGGIGASLRVSTGQMDAASRSLVEAALEDRYGLRDPAVVQYGRWLAKVSPVKFGRRALATPEGEVIRPPRPPREPVVWRWFAESLALPGRAGAGEFSFEAGAREVEKALVYRRGAGDYAQKRADLAAASSRLERALVVYGRAAGIPRLTTPEGKLREAALQGQAPDRAKPEWKEVAAAGRAAIGAFQVASRSHERLLAVIRAGPFPEAGIGIIPGVLSLAPPDLGSSIHSRPVLALIGQALPVTLLLNLMAFPLIYAVAIPSGMLAATHRRRWFDLASGGLFVALWSIPTVWAGTLAIGFLANNQYLGWFPVSGLHASDAESMAFLPGAPPHGEHSFEPGWLLDTLWHIALPVACLVYTGFAVLAKQTRAAMLDNFSADYVRTAKAKGVAEIDVVLHHVFRNSLLPLITMFVQVFPATLAGSVVIERIFSIPGMGTLLLTAIQERDRELILANTIMIAGVNVLALLLADVLYAMADPRVAYK